MNYAKLKKSAKNKGGRVLADTSTFFPSDDLALGCSARIPTPHLVRC